MEKLAEIQSICPVCNKPIPAVYAERDGKVYMEKACQEHGSFQSLIANSADDYRQWVGHPVINVPPKKPMTRSGATDACPLHCGTCENHLQTACCVLIDLTNRCNQHCPYCFAQAEEGGEDAGEPTVEELEGKFDLLLELGEEERPFNLQFSGGEPTVREDLPRIIKLAKDKGFDYIQINSNGRRIGEEDGYARKLKLAGASVIFMQFDGTNDAVYQKLRGEPLLELKTKAIENCRKAGLPVTLVPTIVKDVNLSNIGEMMRFLLDHIAVVKGIHFQPVSFFGRHPESAESGGDLVHLDFAGRVTMFDVLREIERQTEGFHYGDFCPIATGHTLCCFYSTYLKEGPGKIKCMVSKTDKEEGVSCCDAKGSSCCPDPMEVVCKDRDYVRMKWDLPEEGCCDEEKEGCCGGEKPGCCDEEKPGCRGPENNSMDLDQFLAYYKSNTFTVTGMAFQDATNLDAERLKRCRVQVLSQDNRLIPFCGYNSIYRGE